MKTTSETFVRILADDELITVSGAKHCYHRRPVYPWGGKTVTQTNSVGDISIDASGSSGSVSVSVSQSNSAE